MTTLPANRLPPRAPSPDPVRVWMVRLPLLLIMGALLFTIAALALLAAFQMSYRERIVPGVSAFGMPLNGMSRDQAIAALDARFSFDDAVFTFRDPNSERFWQLSARDLGLQFDAAATVDEAMTVGRDSNPVGDIVVQGLTWLNGEALAPVITYDQNIAVAKLGEIARQIDQVPVTGRLAINGTDIAVVPGQAGRTLDVAATLDRLNAQMTRMESGGEIALVINEMAPIVQDVSLAEARARTALSAPVTLVADDGAGGLLGPWTISTDQIAALLRTERVDNGDGTQRYEVMIDMEAFRGYLETLAPGLISLPQDGRFHFNEATGNLDVIRPGIGGRSLNVDATLQRLSETVFSRTDRTATMVFSIEQPRYHNTVSAAELGIRELVAEATTYYTGSSANRRTNIAVAVSRFDGVIIGPGEEFSFNTLLGEISEEAGFVEGLLIFGGRTISGLGGGVCQVSTTIFRAAFTGGFTIIERNSHGYRVGYYELNGQPPGMDAAIWTPERDFRFQNDTPHHLLIEASMYPADNSLQFRFYSTNTGRIVEIEEPRVANITPARPVRYEANSELQPGQVLQVDYAAEGADVNVTRKITYPDGSVREDNIFTHYLPWGAIFQVAPGDARLNQSG